MQTIVLVFVFYTYFSKTSRNQASKFHFESGNLDVETHCLTTTQTQTINNQHSDAILVNRAKYAHALSLVERVLGHFLWDTGPLNVTKRTQKMIFFACNTDLRPKKLVV